MKRLTLLLLAIPLAACEPGATAPSTPSTTPVVSNVCAQISLERFDTALKAYDLASDAVNTLIDFKVIVPGSPTALKIADANDKALAGFRAAEAARKACNADSYAGALSNIGAAITEIRSQLPKK